MLERRERVTDKSEGKQNPVNKHRKTAQVNVGDPEEEESFFFSPMRKMRI